MELEKLKHRQCPECGSPVVQESRRAERHTCGEPFEEQQFDCGAAIEWSPNFGCERRVRPCRKSAAVRAALEKRTQLSAKLLDIVREADVDEDFRDRLISNIRYSH